MEENINVGDVVQLKSGNSPAMTVDKISIPEFGDGEKWALCSWFDGDSEPHRKEFSLSSLKKVSPLETPPPAHQKEIPKKKIGF